MSLVAITRPVSPTIADCALTYLERQSIDPELAAEQHRRYVDALQHLGARIIELPKAPELPDAVFVEDTAVVVDETAIMTAPRLDSRRQEVSSTATVLAQYRELHYLHGDATLEGGDVVRIGRTLYVGLSTRTNREGIDQLAGFLRPYQYDVRATRFEGCLHLKTACTYVGSNTLLANNAWVNTDQFDDVDVLPVGPDEPEAGNALVANGTVLMPSSFPATKAALIDRGFRVVTVNVSELQKAEAGVTCCSILLRHEKL
jgi:dimethylargininase